MFQASRYNVPKREEIQNEISKIEDDIKINKKVELKPASIQEKNSIK